MSDVTSVINHWPTANEGFITTLSGSILSGAATVALTSVSGLTNGTIFVGIIEPGGTKEQTFTGVVDTGGSQITGVIWTRGSNADHSAGVTIVDYVAGTYINMLTKGLKVSHNQDGTIKNLAVGPAMLTQVLQSGWQAGSGTWTYASASTFTVPAADAALVQAGTKIWLTQTTSKYFYVASVSGTTVTIDTNADYTLANAAITAPYLSNQTTPFGFPGWFSFTPTLTNVTIGNGTYANSYKRNGKEVIVRFSMTFGTTSSLAGGFVTTLPTTAITYTGLHSLGQILFFDTSAGAVFGGSVISKTTTTVDFYANGAAVTFENFAVTSATVPFGAAFATGDQVCAQFTYQSA